MRPIGPSSFLTTACLLALVFLVPSPAHADVAVQIEQLDNGGSDAWDAEVKRLFLASYDGDSSGSIDRTEELANIPCPVIVAMDSAVRSRFGKSLRDIYGFHLGTRQDGSPIAWVGDAFGLDRSLRSGADLLAVTCLRGTVGGNNEEGLVEAIGRLPDGGSSAWDGQVKDLLLAAYDRDASGSLDARSEVEGIPCEVWNVMDQAVATRWSAGLRKVYFEGLWLGNLLGFDEAMSSVVLAVLTGCEGPTDSPELPSTEATEDGSAQAGSTAELILSLPNPGQASWDDAVSTLLREAYDSDTSGWIDTDVEVAALDCAVWNAMDTRVTEAQRYGLRSTYGFEEGYGYVGDALGFAESTRALADAALVACIAARSAGDAPATGGSEDSPLELRLGGLERPGSAAWDSDVRQLLVHHYDSNGSGSVDSAAEVSSIPCSTWGRLDESVRMRWGSGLPTIYGFNGEQPWLGNVLGFGARLRSESMDALRRCGLPR